MHFQPFTASAIAYPYLMYPQPQAVGTGAGAEHIVRFGGSGGHEMHFHFFHTRHGLFLGTFNEEFAWHLRMEGSGRLLDGRVINYTGKCKYGYGTCFEELDHDTHPYGRGAGQRALVPFKSVAVDPRFIPIGETLYIPEFDGMRLPDGSVHDGCVRADDTGGGIKKHKMDFFVVSYANFRFLLDELWGVIWITPTIEDPRCDYLRDP